ncbi:MAG TPA: hypothetical protein VG478_15695 [Acidimicrobiales bacterium]|nr:hypothetical protein [Acidimicrobiales bacterium]
MDSNQFFVTLGAEAGATDTPLRPEAGATDTPFRPEAGATVFVTLPALRPGRARRARRTTSAGARAA